MENKIPFRWDLRKIFFSETHIFELGDYEKTVQLLVKVIKIQVLVNVCAKVQTWFIQSWSQVWIIDSIKGIGCFAHILYNAAQSTSHIISVDTEEILCNCDLISAFALSNWERIFVILLNSVLSGSLTFKNSLALFKKYGWENLQFIWSIATKLQFWRRAPSKFLLTFKIIYWVYFSYFLLIVFNVSLVKELCKLKEQIV